MSVQDISVMSWNCRGLNSKIVRNVVRNNIAVVKAKIICIQETKCSQWPDRGMNLLGKGSNEKWVAQKSAGLSGGVSYLLGC